jgi:PIN domain nuclease of toxin-antitoxin system
MSTLLLDTCTFIWLCSSPGKLSGKAVSLLNEKSNELLLSHVSVWEMALKTTAGKMVFPKPLRRWLAEQKAVWRYSYLPITLNVILSSTELPDYHRDPFDRFLVSQALTENIPIITPDPSIGKYMIETIW